MSIQGYLNLGTSLSGQVAITPPASAGYAAQPVSFDTVAGGVTLNGVLCVFGPVSSSWGTLSVFNVTDASGNSYFAGTLNSPFTPVNGQLVVVPQGEISLVVGAQMAVAAAPSVPQRGAQTTGAVALTSGAYAQVLASGSRNMLLVQNPSDVNPIYLVFGGSSAPASGAAASYTLVPFGTWPPAGMSDFVPTDAVWARSFSATGTVNFVTG